MQVRPPTLPPGNLDPNFMGDWTEEEKLKVEQARKAVERFQKQIPTFTGVVRAISGKPKARVFITGDAPHTDGKDVWLRPPGEFGRDDLEHERELCGLRDDRSVMRCEACRVDDMVLGTVYHECAHILHDSFADVDVRQLAKHVQDLIKDLEQRGYVQEHIDTIVQFVQDAAIYGWMAVASAVSPWLPRVVNALEDARVNWSNHQVMPGTFHMVRGSVHHAFDDGIMQPDGSLMFWHEQDLDMQAMISTLSVAQGLGVSWFADEIKQMWDTDADLVRSTERAQRCSDVHELFELAVDVLARLKSHGYCLDKMDYEFYDGEVADGAPSVPPDPNKITFAKTPSQGEGGDDADGEDGDDGDDQGTGSGQKSDDDDAGDGEGSGGDDAESDGDGDSDGSDGGGQITGSDDDASNNTDGDAGSDEVTSGVDLDELKANGVTQGVNAGPSNDKLDEVDNAMNLFGGHDVDGLPDTQSYDSDVPTPDPEHIEAVVNQKDEFDEVSPNVKEVKIDVSEKDKSYSKNGVFEHGGMSYWRMDPVPEQILVGSIARVRKIFKENKRVRRTNSQRHGRVTAKHLSRVAVADPRVFNKTTRPDAKDYGVIIGMDTSGSMSDGTRMKDVKTATYAMAEMLHRVDVPFEVWAHTGGGYWKSIQLIMGEVKTMKEPWGPKQKEALDAVVPTAGNLDGHTMEFYRKRAQALRATDKMILYFTDGDMPAMNYEEELYVLKRELEYIKRDPSLKVMAVGVAGNTEPINYGLDTVLYNGISDIPQLITALEERLTKQ